MAMKYHCIIIISTTKTIWWKSGGSVDKNEIGDIRHHLVNKQAVSCFFFALPRQSLLIISPFFLLIAALLSQTLRTYTRTGCEHEPITLSCPRGTSISIDVSQYMPTTIENECVTATENIIQDGVVNAGTEIEIKAPEKCSSWQSELSVSRI